MIRGLNGEGDDGDDACGFPAAAGPAAAGRTMVLATADGPDTEGESCDDDDDGDDLC